MVTDWPMFIITCVYVGATITICFYNAKSARATKEQTAEMRKQHLENTRARVITRIEFIAGVAYLVFENIGKNIATNVCIDISQEWVELFKKTKQQKDNFERFQELCKKVVYIPSQAKLVYPIFYICDGSGDVTVLSEKPILIEISYNENSGSYHEVYEIDLNGYTGVADYDAYTKLKNKEIDGLKEVTSGLRKIENAVNSLAKNTCADS